MKSSFIYDVACVLAGAGVKPWHIFVGAVIFLIWFGMDVHQYAVMWIDRYLGSAELAFPL